MIVSVHFRANPLWVLCVGGVVCLALAGLSWPMPAAELHPVAAPGNYELHQDLEISLVAREPDVVDPVGLTFDEQGRMFVVEMRDYPYGFGPGHRPGGTIRLLEDTDGDGRMDRSTLFAEGLSFPTSIAAWNGGVIVTAPPEIIFLQDTNGDGKADVREVLLKGFTLGVTDSNVNGLRWGLDNRLHGVNGGNGGTIFSMRKPGPGLPLRNLDFGWIPASGEIAATFQSSGGFGLVFDDWGRSFVTYNINHLQQRIIPVRYLARFPWLPPVEATVSISDHEEMSRIYPVSEPETRVNHPEQSGHFSSAGGMGYLGVPGYPGDLSGSVFVCDVVGNLAHRDLLEASGPVQSARRAPGEATREFFGSRDPAFRPVGLELGPDGALYLVDMQRDVIEHPDYIPAKVRETLNLRAGEDRGRIYRLTPKGGLPVVKPRLRQAASVDLVRLLSHSNQWWRVTAQRLLLERGDRSVVPALRALAGAQSPLGRLHALWTLQGLGSLPETLVLAALVDPNPGLRENALLLAEPRLSASARLRSQVRALATDADARVRFQAALTLGEFQPGDLGASAALRGIFLGDYRWRWTRLAVLSSWHDSPLALLRAAADDTRFRSDESAAAMDAVRELADLAGARAANGRDLAALVVLAGDSRLARWAPVVLEGAQTGWSRSGRTLVADAELTAALQKVSRPDAPDLFAAGWRLARVCGLPPLPAQTEVLKKALEEVLNPDRRVEQQLAAIRVLALGDYPSVGSTLVSLLESGRAPGLREAALAALAEFQEPALAKELTARWHQLAPAARNSVLSLLLGRVAFHDALLTAIEQDQIKLGELNLDLEQRRRLLRKSSPNIMARAAKWIGDEEYGNRKKIVDDWLKRLPATGEAVRGRTVFERLCTPCHALGGVGTAVGPDLGALAHRSVEDLVSNILDPNMAIAPAYVSFTAETADGEIETGILHSESADTIVLRQALGREVVLPRARIKHLKSSGLSLMPEGLEAGMTAADLRDLVAFLQLRR